MAINPYAAAGGIVLGGLSEILANKEKKKEREKIDKAIDRIEAERNRLESQRLNTMESFINQYAMTMDPNISQGILKQYAQNQMSFDQRDAQLSQQVSQLELSKPTTQSTLSAFGSGAIAASLPIAGNIIGSQLSN